MEVFTRTACSRASGPVCRQAHTQCARPMAGVHPSVTKEHCGLLHRQALRQLWALYRTSCSPSAATVFS